MPMPGTSHPPTPTPTGATTRELQTIATLHRQAMTTDDRPAASAMLEGVRLIAAS